jgi:cell division protein FtsQ
LAISISLRAESGRPRAGLRAGVLGVAAVVALGLGGSQLTRSSLVHARAIEVTGAARLSRAEVVARAAVSRATNVWWLDELAVEQRLEADPWIVDARVSTGFPATIRIEIVERSPVAVASDRLGDLLVAADGTALGPAGRTRGLPRIEVVGASTVEGARPSRAAAASVLGAMTSELRASVVVVTMAADGSVELRLRGGIRVGYGSAAQPTAKAQALDRILSWANVTGERILWVSIAAPNAPAVRLAD